MENKVKMANKVENKKEVVYNIKFKAQDIINIQEMVDSSILLGIYTKKTNLVEKGILYMKLMEDIKEQSRNQLIKKVDEKKGDK